MHQDDESQLTIAKWPFYLGDALLVCVALAIAILGHWQLSDWQVFSCVVAVALGACLFVLPYLAEYAFRVTELKEDRGSSLRVHERMLQQLDAAQDELSQQLRILGQRLDDAQGADQRVVAVLDQKMLELEALKAQAVSQQEQLQAQASGLEEVKVVLADQARLQALEARVDACVSEAQVANLAEGLASLARKVEESVDVEDAQESNLPAVQAQMSVLEGKIQGLEQAVQAAVRPVSRSARQRRTSAGGMLHRAINEKQDAASAAVSRIIKAGPNVVGAVDSKSKPAAVESVKEVAESEALAATADSSAVDVAEVKDDAAAEVTGESADVAVENASMDVHALKASSDAVGDGVFVESTESDLFGDTVPSECKSKVRAKQKDAVLTAQVLIGIGNKPFVRGTGGGLNLETGVLMDFQEIGKWRWVAPVDLEGPIEVHIYRNDEDPDRKGPYRIKPGQKLEVEPVF